jgi:hypothetical protein
MEMNKEIENKIKEYEDYFKSQYSMFMAPEDIIAEIDYCIKNNISQYEKVKAEFLKTGMTEEEFNEILF